jgi:hypothetical protein
MTLAERLKIGRMAMEEGCTPRVAALISFIDPEIESSIEDYLQEIDPGEIEEAVRVLGEIHSLVVHDEGVVVKGEMWNLSDGMGDWNEDPKLTIDEIFQEIDVDCWRSDEDGRKTSWVTINAWLKIINYQGMIECINDARTVEIPPVEPECSEELGHDWRSPYSVLGGLEENPGVWGNGGGVIMKRVCWHCGMYKVTNTWDYNPEDGTQGLTSVEYLDADDESLVWIESQKE